MWAGSARRRAGCQSGAADQLDERGADVDVAQPGAGRGHQQRRGVRAWMGGPPLALIGAQRRDRTGVQRNLAELVELPGDGEYAMLVVEVGVVEADPLADS